MTTLRRRRALAWTLLLLLPLASASCGPTAVAGPTVAGPATAGGGVVVCLGTSTTAGYGVAADASYVARLRARLAGRSVSVVGDGHGGWSTADFLDHADAVVGRVPPDAVAVVLQVGTNDVRWPGPADADAAAGSAARVEQLAARVRARAPAAALVLLTPTAVEPDRMTDAVRRAGFGDRTPARLAAVTDAYRRLAARRGWRLVDASAIPPAGHTHDGLHPDAVGHARIADAVWAALDPLIPGDSR